jgi:hypothetical protein
MKSFKEYITEHGIMNTAGLSSNKMPYDLNDNDVKNAVNAVLGHVAVSEFLNPKAAVAQMEAKLGQLGLMRKNVPSDDPRNESSGDEFSGNGEFEVAFSHGEIIGKSVDTPIDELDKDERLVNLRVRYEQLETGTFKVYGQIV